MIEIREYVDPLGRSPHAIWFNALNHAAAAKVARGLYQLAAGNLSNIKGVGAGVFERKLDFGPGYRIHFGKDGEALIVLLGAAPSSDSKRPSRRPRFAGPTIGATSEGQPGGDMALTKDFKETVLVRAQRDVRFREALFTEAIGSYLAGDTAAGKALLRDLVNATVGFEGLAIEMGKPSKSLHRMLAPRGNPSTDNFFEIVRVLQKKTRVRLRVTARAA